MMSSEHRRAIIPPLLLLLLAILLPFRGIQWGDGLEFVAVASHLGVAHPPGYPLFTLLAWMLLWIPTPEPYAAVLLGCRLAAWGAALLVTSQLFRLRYIEGSSAPSRVLIGVAIPTLILFSPLVRESLHQIEIYTFQALLVLGTTLALIPGQRPCRHRLLVGGILFGLAMANHLPALSLAPLLFFSLARHIKRGGDILTGAIALAAPSVLIPIILYGTLPFRAASGEQWGIAWGATTNLGALLIHLRGGEYGLYQLLQSAPGQAMTFPIWLQFVGTRLLQFLQAMGDLLPLPQAARMLAGVGLVFLAVVGASRLWYTQRSWLLGVVTAFTLQFSFITVYNIPDIQDYFTPLILLIVPIIGAGWLRLVHNPFATALPIALLAVGAVVGSFTRHQPVEDLPELYRTRLVEAIPPDAALITSGDADIYTMWYEQHARRNRLDVAVVGGNFVRFPWFRQTIPAGDTRREAVRFQPGPPPHSLDAFIDQLNDNVVQQLLPLGPVYWSVTHPAEVQSMRRHVRVTPVAEMLSIEELGLIQQARLVNFPPSILYRIESLNP